MHATAPGFTATRALHAYDVTSVPTRAKPEKSRR